MANDFHPFRQGSSKSDSSSFAFERPADPGAAGDGGGRGWFGDNDDNDDSGKKIPTKQKIFITVAVAVAALCIITVSFSSLLPKGNLGLSGLGFGKFRKKHHVESTEEYDLPIFADEDEIKDADNFEKNRPRDVREANRELGFFRNLFCRGLKRASFCD